MANFIPGWKFSPANRPEISASLLKQILWKPNCRLNGDGFSTGRNSARAENPSPVFSNRDRIFSPAKRAWKSHVIETEFQPGPKKELEHAHWLCFRTSGNFLTEICVLRPGWNWACHNNNQPGGRSEISARAETHHVMPLASSRYKNCTLCHSFIALNKAMTCHHLIGDVKHVKKYIIFLACGDMGFLSHLETL